MNRQLNRQRLEAVQVAYGPTRHDVDADELAVVFRRNLAECVADTIHKWHCRCCVACDAICVSSAAPGLRAALDPRPASDGDDSGDDADARAKNPKGGKGDRPAGYSFENGVPGVARDELRHAAEQRLVRGRQRRRRLVPFEPTVTMLMLHVATESENLMLWLASILLLIGFMLESPTELLGYYVAAVLLVAMVLLSIALAYKLKKAAGKVALRVAGAAPMVTVRLDGDWVAMQVEALVPGDVIRLRTGDAVPADVRLLHMNPGSPFMRIRHEVFHADGEFVEKRPCTEPGATPLLARRNTIYAGSVVDLGDGVAVVTHIGEATLERVHGGPTRGRKPRGDTLVWSLGRVEFALVALTIGVVVVVSVGWLVNLRAALGVPTVGLAIVAIMVPGLAHSMIMWRTRARTQLAARGVLLADKGAPPHALSTAARLCMDKTGVMTSKAMSVTNVLYNGTWHDTELATPTPGVAPLPQAERGAPALRTLLKCIKLSTRTVFQEADVAAAATGAPDALLFAAPQDGAAPVLNRWRTAGGGAPLLRFAQYMSFPNQEAARTAAVDMVAAEHAGHPIVAAIPFTAANKWSVIVRRCAATPHQPYTVYMKGASERVLDRCDRAVTTVGVQPLTDELRAELVARLHESMQAGRRLFGFAFLPLNPDAYGVRNDGDDFRFDASEDGLNFPVGDPTRDVDDDKGAGAGAGAGVGVGADANAGAATGAAGAEVAVGRHQKLIFAGFTGALDPPRPGVTNVIDRCRMAGMRLAMLTGDHPLTAVAVARQTGMLGADATFNEIDAENTAAGWPPYGAVVDDGAPFASLRADSAGTARQVAEAALERLAAADGVADNIHVGADWVTVLAARAHEGGGAAPSAAVIEQVMDAMPAWRDPSVARSRVVAGHQLQAVEDDDAWWQRLLDLESIVFARVSPQHKRTIVRRMQAFEKRPQQRAFFGAINRDKRPAVAFVGDGPNDVAAMIQADVSIAVGSSACTAAKQVADMVLMDNESVQSMCDIMDAGAGILDNMRRSTVWGFGSALAKLLPSLFVAFVGFPWHLSPLALVVLALATSWLAPLVSALTPLGNGDRLEPMPPSRRAAQRHVSPSGRILNKRTAIAALCFYGVLHATAGLFAWSTAMRSHGYPLSVLPGLGLYNNWGHHPLYCQLEGGTFRNVNGDAVTTVTPGTVVSFATAAAAFDADGFFWDADAGDGSVTDCLFASKNVEGTADKPVAGFDELDRFNPSTFVGTDKLYTGSVPVVSRQSIEALQQAGYVEYMPWLAVDASPMWDPAWLAWPAGDTLSTLLPDRDYFDSFAVQYVGYFDVADTASSCSGLDADGVADANELLASFTGTATLCSNATFVMPQRVTTYTGTRRFGGSWDASPVNSTTPDYRLRLASRLMMFMVLKEAQAAYFIAVLMVHTAAFFATSTRVLPFTARLRHRNAIATVLCTVVALAILVQVVTTFQVSVTLSSNPWTYLFGFPLAALLLASEEVRKWFVRVEGANAARRSRRHLRLAQQQGELPPVKHSVTDTLWW